MVEAPVYLLAVFGYFTFKKATRVFYDTAMTNNFANNR